MNSTPLLDRSFIDAVGFNSLISLAGIILLLMLGWWLVLRRRATIRSNLGPVFILVATFLFSTGSSFIPWLSLLSMGVLSGVVLLIKAWRARSAGRPRNGSNEPWNSILAVTIFVAVVVLSFEVLISVANLAAAAVSPQQSATVVLHKQAQDPKTQRLLLMFDMEGDFGDVWLSQDYAARFKEGACYTVTYHPSPFLPVEGRSRVYATRIQENATCP